MASTSTSTSVQTFVQRNKQAILLGAAAVLVVAGGLAYSSYSSPANSRPSSSSSAAKSADKKAKKSKGSQPSTPATDKEGEQKPANDVVQDGQSPSPLPTTSAAILEIGSPPAPPAAPFARPFGVFPRWTELRIFSTRSASEGE